MNAQRLTIVSAPWEREGAPEVQGADGRELEALMAEVHRHLAQARSWSPWVEEVTTEDILSEIDTRARDVLGMSGSDFAQRYLERSLPDTLTVAELGILLRSVQDAKF